MNWGGVCAVSFTLFVGFSKGPVHGLRKGGGNFPLPYKAQGPSNPWGCTGSGEAKGNPTSSAAMKGGRAGEGAGG